MARTVGGPSYGCPVTITPPVPAVHLRDLPVDHRGFAVPAEAPWVDGVPYQAKVDPPMKLLLAAYRACPVCGFTLPSDEPVWRIHDDYSRTVTHEEINRQPLIPELDVPGHLVCMLYSALVCPFWRSPGGRLDKDTIRWGEGKRGAEPSIMGFEDYAVLIHPSLPLEAQPFTLMYRKYECEIVFRDPLADLADRYEQERRRCGGRYVSKKRRHYAPAFGGAKRLAKETEHVIDYLTSHQPDAVVEGGAGLFRSGFAR